MTSLMDRALNFKCVSAWMCLSSIKDTTLVVSLVAWRRQWIGTSAFAWIMHCVSAWYDLGERGSVELQMCVYQPMTRLHQRYCTLVVSLVAWRRQWSGRSLVLWLNIAVSSWHDLIGERGGVELQVCVYQPVTRLHQRYYIGSVFGCMKASVNRTFTCALIIHCVCHPDMTF